ncbi:hypothetical protein [Paenibacillus lignilyticus]|uniref:LytTR family transcriptional regulator n=1 Tax=Paenibacillus lignilyticus TaxID=1172615 RepID=A0ABS5CI82_9BACL|nr:hypothetical protein [Paenibacillus lignilyticus]MBP3965592.1 hypothetical protein [Paenibacillus lignilyticus]
MVNKSNERTDSIYVYCVKMEPVNNQVICRNLNLATEVLYMGVTPQLRGKSSYKPGIPMFVTMDGVYLQLVNVEHYKRVLTPLGYDLFHPSCLVNVPLVDRIEVGLYGNDAFFKGDAGISVPISKAKIKKYSHLLVKVN